MGEAVSTTSRSSERFRYDSMALVHVHVMSYDLAVLDTLWRLPRTLDSLFTSKETNSSIADFVILHMRHVLSTVLVRVAHILLIQHCMCMYVCVCVCVCVGVCVCVVVMISIEVTKGQTDTSKVASTLHRTRYRAAAFSPDGNGPDNTADITSLLAGRSVAVMSRSE